MAGDAGRSGQRLDAHRRKTFDMRFDLFLFLLTDLLHVQPIGQPSLIKILQQRQLFPLGGHNDLPADLMLDPVLYAEFDDGTVSFAG